MRMFLPIKGPGGRALTPKEKAALVVLGVTLVLCVLTLLAGESAYLDEPARNPVFGLVELLSRAFGGGIVALYGIVLLWSGLIFFKGERVADVTPLPGRVAAALAVTMGVSGILGIGQLDTAGNLGLLVGGAMDHTFGSIWSLPVLLLMLLLGLHLAGQGAWSAFREPMAAVASSPAPAAPSGMGFSLQEPPSARVAAGPPLPDDGDPSPDERSFAVTQAMEEIERSQGVTIVDVRPSIGEEVDEAEPGSGTEEGEVRDAIETVESMIHGLRPVPAEAAREEDEAEDWEEEEDYEEASEEDEFEEEGEEGEYEEEAEEEEDEEEDAEYEEDEGEEEDAQPEEEEDEKDPYARGGLLRRRDRTSAPPATPADPDRSYTNFDWRGRPLE